MPNPVFWPGILLLGIVTGLIAGMFGVGGGFLLTPALYSWFGVPTAIAVGSALSQKCGTSVVSFLKFKKFGHGDTTIDLYMIGGALMGADAGARLLSYLDSLGTLPFGTHMKIDRFTLNSIFIVMLGWVAWITLREVKKVWRNKEFRGDKTIPGPLVTLIRIPPFVELPRVGLSQVSLPMLVFVGFFTGAASSLLGIGGGVLFTPIVMYGLGLSMRNSSGTGVLLLLVTVAYGSFIEGLNHHVSLGLAMLILVGSSIGSVIGATITHTQTNRRLRLVFGLLALTTVLLNVFDILAAF